MVINTIGEGDTLDDMYTFISERVETWGQRHVLWDMTLFDGQSVSGDVRRAHIEKGEFLSEKRSGLKTAMFADTDLAFGTLRMLQLMSEEKFKFTMKIFRNKVEAVEWLNK